MNGQLPTSNVQLSIAPWPRLCCDKMARAYSARMLRRTSNRALYTFLRNEPNFFWMKNSIYPSEVQGVIRYKSGQNIWVRFRKTNPIWGVKRGGGKRIRGEI